MAGWPMAATSWLIRKRVRRRALAMLPLALIVTAGATGALVALGAAHRTSTAYERYVERAAVGDLQINPSMPTAEIDEVIRSLPGVRSVTTHVLLNAGPGEGESTTLADIDNGDPAQVRGSSDGRYITMDRPSLAAGRLPTGPDEAVVNVEMAKQRGFGIGDVVPLSFFGSAGQLIAEDGAPDTPLPSVGVERVTVVGIATLPDEVLPDGLYPRQRMIVSPDVAERYDCSPLPLPEDGTYEEIAAAVFPGRCAINYRYYSLKVDGGDRGVAAALDEFVRRGTELNANLPPALRQRGVQYFLIPTTTAKNRDGRGGGHGRGPRASPFGRGTAAVVAPRAHVLRSHAARRRTDARGGCRRAHRCCGPGVVAVTGRPGRQRARARTVAEPHRCPMGVVGRVGDGRRPHGRRRCPRASLVASGRPAESAPP
jgi:hypothetical protein